MYCKGEVKTIKPLKNIDISKLTDRSDIVLDNTLIDKIFSNKTILVTGGGGSIGSAICTEILKYKPRLLLMLDICENSVYELSLSLKQQYPKEKTEIIICNICDFTSLSKIFKKFKPDIVIHTAAHKHVPLMETNAAQAVKNNVFGTYNVVSLAKEYCSEKFVLISTDKAVNPTSVMGATKRMCENIVSSIKTGTFVTVRLGNVLDSSGSVIPIFKKQIVSGGPITVTHPEITRFFMSIPEAASLVLQAACYAKGGEIFVLDMGKPVKIYDLAKKMICLSGLKPDVDIKIEFIGLRPGEKLHEELLTNEKGLTKTAHSKIFVEQAAGISFNELSDKLRLLETALECDNEKVKEILSEVVPTYKPRTISQENG